MSSSAAPLLLLVSAGLAGCQLTFPSGPADPAESADPTRLYSGYQVLRVQIPDNATLELLQSYADGPGVDFWSHVTHLSQSADVLVSPEARQQLLADLNSKAVEYQVFIDDVQGAIDSEAFDNFDDPLDTRIVLGRDRPRHAMTWSTYHRLADHLDYMEHVETQYAGLCRTFDIGTSYEGRPLRGVSCGLGDREVWIDGGMHAREWISPAAVSFLIREFSENSAQSQDILTEFTIYMIPVLNSDGYEYSHEVDRLWRKTRSPNNGSACVGTDPNRNFAIHWLESGSSSRPCSNTYAGSAAFSEPETDAMKNFLLRHRNEMEMYISVHSYSQIIYVPYAYTRELPPDYDDLERVARVGADAILEAGGPEFQVKQASNPNYTASGGSDDWAKAVAGIKYAYTFELRDRGQFGFVLPPVYILPSARETAAAVKAMLRAIL